MMRGYEKKKQKTKNKKKQENYVFIKSLIYLKEKNKCYLIFAIQYLTPDNSKVLNTLKYDLKLV